MCNCPFLTTPTPPASPNGLQTATPSTLIPASSNEAPVLVIGWGSVISNLACTVPPAGMVSFETRISAVLGGSGLCLPPANRLIAAAKPMAITRCVDDILGFSYLGGFELRPIFTIPDWAISVPAESKAETASNNVLPCDSSLKMLSGRGNVTSPSLPLPDNIFK